MTFLEECKEQVLREIPITAAQALRLYHEELAPLCEAANDIRLHFCQNRFDLCTIVNAKSGSCSENCSYCAQSIHHGASCEEYPLLPQRLLKKDAQHHAEQGVLRYSLVTSGKRLPEADLEKVCETVQEISQAVPIQLCGSFGLLEEAALRRLAAAGITRFHNNLETSREYFPRMCTTHTFEDKVKTIKAAQAAGLTVCSGGIFGIGESVEDRISLAISLRELSITSVPINLLHPIAGTPCEHNIPLTNEELRRIVATYRFLLPKAMLRLAGGRKLLPDQGRSVFLSGANAAITGDLLTTAGITTQSDLQMLHELGFVVETATR